MSIHNDFKLICLRSSLVYLNLNKPFLSFPKRTQVLSHHILIVFHIIKYSNFNSVYDFIIEL